MKKTNLFFALGGLSLLLNLIVSACGPTDADATPTLSPEQMQTLAVITFSAGLTQTEMARPTDTPTPTVSPSPTETSTLAITNTPGKPSVPGAGSAPVSSCNSLAFIADVTIPDNTTMKPGQKFTKTWRVKNNGTCAWEAGFKFGFTGGNAMGGPTFSLAQAVSPGTETDLSIAMTAPNTSGSHQGNWRMSNTAGTPFGDEVYLIIVVGGSSSTTTTPATPGTSAIVTATQTETETPTEPPTVP